MFHIIFIRPLVIIETKISMNVIFISCKITLNFDEILTCNVGFVGNL